MVNVNELMIGDYVDVGVDGCPPAVAVVEEIYGKANKVLLNICKSSVTFDADDISPIMLTKDFFLRNGFTELYADKHIVGLYNRDNYLMVDMFLLRCCFKCRISKIGFKYVHEFQHYLRLIGLSEMANNLKL